MKDFFSDFEARTFTTAGAEIFARIGGNGPPLLLVHGYPQCHVMWHKVAPALANHFTLVIADLRGYGQSSCPKNDEENLAFSKRVMAQDMLGVMSELGHHRFALAGHDRGGRVGYRLALDAPDRVEKLAVLDIVPTYTMWQRFTVAHAMKVYHWLFLAQPQPLPEMLIERAPTEYQDYTLASWSKAKNLSAFDKHALDAYHEFFSKPDHIHATCNDYRAGQSCDYQHDKEDFDLGRKIVCPVLALWGTAGLPAGGESPADIWREWADDVQGVAVDAGHFIAEENAPDTAQALLDFLS